MTVINGSTALNATIATTGTTRNQARLLTGLSTAIRPHQLAVDVDMHVPGIGLEREATRGYRFVLAGNSRYWDAAKLRANDPAAGRVFDAKDPDFQALPAARYAQKFRPDTHLDFLPARECWIARAERDGAVTDPR